MKIIRHKMCKYHVRDIMFINNFRKIFLKLGIYIILLGIAVLVALLPNLINNKNNVAHREARYTTDLKYILFWKHAKRNKKNFFNKDEVYAHGQKAFIKQDCPNINCFITYNKSLLQNEGNFDAIVFNVHDVKKLKVRHYNFERSPHQKYIFKSFDPAQKHPVCNPSLDNFFNWTWTYKLDSDIPHPFINIIDSKNTRVGPSINMKWTEVMRSSDKYRDKISNKTKAVAWFISSCKLKNKHLEFVKDLKNELKGYNYSLDTFGPCGQYKCGKKKLSSDGCHKQIEKDYYFQLVLEDTVAQDYVTEVMAKAMSYVTVPIILGSNFSSFLPPGSHINAGVFDLKKLGAVIDYLVRNPKKYSFFFDWKSYYYYTIRPRSYICDLCTKLNEDTKVKSFTNFRRWWKNDFEDVCESLYLHNKFKDI